MLAPSVVLVVVDTLRADAVSAYGAVSGTTPFLDTLAARGLRYSNAYANADWTLPSHATLFTGLLPSAHGVRLGAGQLPAEAVTVAELLSARGYETMGVTENPWLGSLARGFDRLSQPTVNGSLYDIVAEWLKSRSRDRPFFLFLNIMDAHEYAHRETSPFLPPDVGPTEARGVGAKLNEYLCRKTCADRESRILWGQYLASVQAADKKLSMLVGLLRKGTERPLVVIVTSDHGEAFGERGLFVHGYGLGEALLRVPLVIDGLTWASPAVIDTPVQLADVAPTILSWAGIPPPPGTIGAPLPTRPTTTQPRPLFAEHSEGLDTLPPALRKVAKALRRPCRPEHRMFGDSRSVLVSPFRLIRYQFYPPLLFDVSRDPQEQHDLQFQAHDRVASLGAELDRVFTSAPHAAPKAAIDPATAEKLRALGYFVGPDAGDSPPRPSP